MNHIRKNITVIGKIQSGKTQVTKHFLSNQVFNKKKCVVVDLYDEYADLKEIKIKELPVYNNQEIDQKPVRVKVTFKEDEPILLQEQLLQILKAFTSGVLVLGDTVKYMLHCDSTDLISGKILDVMTDPHSKLTIISHWGYFNPIPSRVLETTSLIRMHRMYALSLPEVYQSAKREGTLNDEILMMVSTYMINRINEQRGTTEDFLYIDLINREIKGSFHKTMLKRAALATLCMGDEQVIDKLIWIMDKQPNGLFSQYVKSEYRRVLYEYLNAKDEEQEEPLQQD